MLALLFSVFLPATVVPNNEVIEDGTINCPLRFFRMPSQSDSGLVWNSEFENPRQRSGSPGKSSGRIFPPLSQHGAGDKAFSFDSETPFLSTSAIAAASLFGHDGCLCLFAPSVSTESTASAISRVVSRPAPAVACCMIWQRVSLSRMPCCASRQTVR